MGRDPGCDVRVGGVDGDGVGGEVWVCGFLGRDHEGEGEGGGEGGEDGGADETADGEKID